MHKIKWGTHDTIVVKVFLIGTTVCMRGVPSFIFSIYENPAGENAI
jgi:hypothetical protein